MTSDSSRARRRPAWRGAAAAILAATAIGVAPATASPIAPNPNSGTISIAPGELVWNDESFRNFGTIALDGVLENRALLANEDSGAVVGSGALVNTASGRVENGGLVQLVGGSAAGIDNAGAFVQASTGTLDVDALVNRRGATFEVQGFAIASGHVDNAGTLLVTGFPGLTAGGTLANAASGVVDVDGQLDVFGAMSNEGLVRVGALGLFSQVGPSSRIVQSATGSLEIEGSFFQNAGELEIGGGLRLHPAAVLSVAGRTTVRPDARLDADGSVDILSGGSIRVDGFLQVGDLLRSRGTLVNTGSMELSGELDQQLGVLENRGSWWSRAGSDVWIRAEASAPTNAAGASWLQEGRFGSRAGLDNAGLFTNRGTASLEGASRNDGTLVNEAPCPGCLSAFLAIGGRLDQTGTLRNRPDAMLDLVGEMATTASSRIENEGFFRIAASAAVTGAGLFVQRAGVVQVEGLLEQGTVDATGGLLTGAGTVRGLLHQQGGVVRPTGVLTLDGRYRQDAGATLSIELGGTTPGSGHDVLAVALQASVLGEVEVSLRGGTTPFLPTAGDVFDVLTAASIDASGARFLLPALGPDLRWLTSVESANGGEVLRLAVAAVPESSRMALLALALLLPAAVRHGRRLPTRRRARRREARPRRGGP